MVKTIWVLTSPDNEHYDEEYAVRTVQNLAWRAEIKATATGRTRDAGFGHEQEYELEGEEKDIEFFESCLKDALY